MAVVTAIVAAFKATVVGCITIAAVECIAITAVEGSTAVEAGNSRGSAAGTAIEEHIWDRVGTSSALTEYVGYIKFTAGYMDCCMGSADFFLLRLVLQGAV